MKKYYSLLLLALSFAPCYGAAQQVNIYLGQSGNTAYAVPAGKTLIIHRAALSGTSSTGTTEIRYTVLPDNLAGSLTLSQQISSSYTSGKYVSIAEKITLGAGATLRIPNNGSYNYILYAGVLIDTTDLYAANLPVELENTRITGNKLMADAKVKSPRPHRLIVESSPDLTGFAADVSAAVAATGTTGTSVVSVDKGATGKKFIRVAAKTRPRK
ncbi:MAG: hypothetical protein ACPG32_03625 [Akkermansiaceae bacterium]